MSKFDAVYKKIEEQLPVATGTQPNQPKPTLNPTQQQEVEKLADQLSKINDPKQIKDILATIMQGITHPQNGVATQPKPAV
jgi:hypothetical protein